MLAGGRVFERTAPAKPVEDLAGLITRTLADAGIGLADVGQLVVGVGPGSYMGVRAAVSTANALSFAAGLPITGVVSTDALAVLAAPDRASITVGLHAGRRRVFVARYARGSDGRLERDALPALLSEDEWMAERAGGAASLVIVDDGMPPDAGPEPQRHPLLASGVLRVFVEQPHLLVAGEPAGAVPILPPATIGAGR